MALKIPPPVWLALFAALMWLGGKYLPINMLWYFPTIAIVLFLLGSAIMITALFAFRRAQTTVNPLQPAQTRMLVTHGIYRLSRNPMYLGMALYLGAWALWLGYPPSWLGVIGFILCINHFQIVPEENILRAKFVSDYDHYCQHTRRWL